MPGIGCSATLCCEWGMFRHGDCPLLMDVNISSAKMTVLSLFLSLSQWNFSTELHLVLIIEGFFKWHLKLLWDFFIHKTRIYFWILTSGGEEITPITHNKRSDSQIFCGTFWMSNTKEVFIRIFLCVFFKFRFFKKNFIFQLAAF